MNFGREYNEAEVIETANGLLSSFPDTRIFLFHGEMGAGKTTLIKAMCSALGSRDAFSSPTFSIINEYECAGSNIYHMDLFRIKDEWELNELGLEEYLYSGAYCFIEWPEKVKPFISSPYAEVVIKHGDNFRYINARSVI